MAKSIVEFLRLTHEKSSPKNSRKKKIGKSLVNMSTLNLNISMLGGMGEQKEDDILQVVERSCIGNDLTFQGPFGERKAVYCDFTASGKSISFIEDFIREEVLNYYGNVHTTTSISSARTTALRKEAKDIIRQCLNCTNDDVVIFASSGLTGAINKLIRCLNCKEPIVFISPYEHHSNILPWLEIGAEVVYGKEDENGKVDLEYLQQMLVKYATKGRRMIGSFSSASNVTGILTDTISIATLLHSHGALALFDYATAGPYVDIDMNPKDEHGNVDPWAYKDAVLCSIHKFVGGPQTPGLLVAKKWLFQNTVPSSPGGGTVVFVGHNNVEYVKDVEEREEGGTPAIVEGIRAGLVFQLKQEIGCERILREEHKLAKQILTRLDKVCNLYVLGGTSAERLPIVSFVVKHERSGRLLHQNFVSALLNDLFGLQVRGGCSCAGPYAMDLLGISTEVGDAIQNVLMGDYEEFSKEATKSELEKVTGMKYEILKPGFTRLNLPFFYSEQTNDYIIMCIEFAAQHAWKFLPFYEMEPVTNDFKHRASNGKSSIEDLKQLSSLNYNSPNKQVVNTNAPNFQMVLDEAEKMAKELQLELASFEASQCADTFLPASIDKALRWFLTPRESLLYLQDEHFKQDYTPLFVPRTQQMDYVDRVQKSRFYGPKKSLKRAESIKLGNFQKDTLTFAKYQKKGSRESSITDNRVTETQELPINFDDQKSNENIKPTVFDVYY